MHKMKIEDGANSLNVFINFTKVYEIEIWVSVFNLIRIIDLELLQPFSAAKIFL